MNHDVFKEIWCHRTMQIFAITTSVMKYDSQRNKCMLNPLWIHLKDVLNPAINVCTTIPYPIPICSKQSAIGRLSTRWVKSSTLPETNSDFTPENWCLGDKPFLLGRLGPFSEALAVSFRKGSHTLCIYPSYKLQYHRFASNLILPQPKMDNQMIPQTMHH